jgi:translation elongation factor EF-Tu-like GTPase
LPEDTPHWKLLRGVIILRKEDRSRVLDFLGRYSLTLYVREVKLTAEDEMKLREFQD